MAEAYYWQVEVHHYVLGWMAVESYPDQEEAQRRRDTELRRFAVLDARVRRLETYNG